MILIKGDSNKDIKSIADSLFLSFLSTILSIIFSIPNRVPLRKNLKFFYIEKLTMYHLLTVWFDLLTFLFSLTVMLQNLGYNLQTNTFLGEKIDFTH